MKVTELDRTSQGVTDTTPFPRCELHQQLITGELPSPCPLAADDINRALLELQDRSYWRRDGDNLHAAVSNAKVNRICSRCVPRLLGNPHVKFLRSCHV